MQLFQPVLIPVHDVCNTCLLSGVPRFYAEKRAAVSSLSSFAGDLCAPPDTRIRQVIEIWLP